LFVCVLFVFEEGRCLRAHDLCRQRC
jgi:hypothetical protein